jgi:hypothetical protein
VTNRTSWGVTSSVLRINRQKQSPPKCWGDEGQKASPCG